MAENSRRRYDGGKNLDGMYRVVKKIQLNPYVVQLEFEAGDIALAAAAGQFVILRVDESGERFPLTIYDFDVKHGTVTVVAQIVGVSTRKLSLLNIGDSILNVAGPLGRAVAVDGIGRVVCVGGGVGTAEIYPIARAMARAGNDVSVIAGFRHKEVVICEKELRGIVKEVFITTDDGSYSRKGFVTDVLKEILDKDKPDLVFAVGPLPMMRAVADLTRGCSVKTDVSLNSIMVDGTGMCGSCRVIYDGKIRFACVDGPDFDAHKLDFDDMIARQGRYADKERAADHAHKCKLDSKFK